ncbi:MAG: NnrU family protein [Pseudomonadota bacterium]
MALIFAGVLLWTFVHLLPAAAPAARGQLLGKMGEGGYKGLFSVLVLLSVTLMVVGWRSATPSIVYSPPYDLRPVAIGLLVLAFILLGAANQPVRIRRVVRHPQLSGVALFSFAHLLANGDSRSVVLFGGLLIWALLEMPLISRREGVWQKPEVKGWGREFAGVVVALLIMLALAWAHPWIAGVPVAMPSG